MYMKLIHSETLMHGSGSGIDVLYC